MARLIELGAERRESATSSGTPSQVFSVANKILPVGADTITASEIPAQAD